MNYVFGLAAFALCLVNAAGAVWAQSPGEESVRMMAHWRCATWAGMAGDQIAREEHFSEGLVSGRRFVDAAKSGEIGDSDWNSMVPWGVAMTMAGPSTDFVLGRLFAFVSDDAFDQVAKRDPTGMPLSAEDYVLDNEIQAVLASNLMHRSNCSLL